MNFWKKNLVISFLFFSLITRFLFICHSKLLLSLPPPDMCLCTWQHLRALAGTAISGSLTIRSWSAGGYLLIGVPGTQAPGAQGAIENCVFATEIYFLRNHNRILYPSTCLQLHTHMCNHGLKKKNTLKSFILICPSAARSRNIMLRIVSK